MIDPTMPEADASSDEAYELGVVAGYDKAMRELEAVVPNAGVVLDKMREHIAAGPVSFAEIVSETLRPIHDLLAGQNLETTHE